MLPLASCSVTQKDVLLVFFVSDAPAVQKRPSETALLLSLCGVGCVVLHQWPSSLPERTQSVDSVLDCRFSPHRSFTTLDVCLIQLPIQQNDDSGGRGVVFTCTYEDLSSCAADLLRARHTCGQSVHALRRGSASDAPHHKPTFGTVNPLYCLINLECFMVGCRTRPHTHTHKLLLCVSP